MNNLINKVLAAVVNFNGNRWALRVDGDGRKWCGVRPENVRRHLWTVLGRKALLNAGLKTGTRFYHPDGRTWFETR